MSLDLASFVRSGDTVVWGQASAEPTTLVELLLDQAAAIGPVRCFVGIPAQSALTRETIPASLAAHSYCGAGTNAAMHEADRLEIWPVHYSALPDLLSGGELHADVVFVQVSPPDERGRHSLGLADDYFSAALDSARVVIAEVNDRVPFTYGARTLTADDWVAAVHTSRPPGELPTPPVSTDVRAVARNVAGLVPDGATLQFGIGALPEAVLAELFEHRDLGIHSGIINDTAMRLVRAGVANGARKTLDRGVAIGGLLGGTSELFTWAHRNPAGRAAPDVVHALSSGPPGHPPARRDQRRDRGRPDGAGQRRARVRPIRRRGRRRCRLPARCQQLAGRRPDRRAALDHPREQQDRHPPLRAGVDTPFRGRGGRDRARCR